MIKRETKNEAGEKGKPTQKAECNSITYTEFGS